MDNKVTRQPSPGAQKRPTPPASPEPSLKNPAPSLRDFKGDDSQAINKSITGRGVEQALPTPSSSAAAQTAGSRDAAKAQLRSAVDALCAPGLSLTPEKLVEALDKVFDGLSQSELDKDDVDQLARSLSRRGLTKGAAAAIVTVLVFNLGGPAITREHVVGVFRGILEHAPDDATVASMRALLDGMCARVDAGQAGVSELALPTAALSALFEVVERLPPDRAHHEEDMLAGGVQAFIVKRKAELSQDSLRALTEGLTTMLLRRKALKNRGEFIDLPGLATKPRIHRVMGVKPLAQLFGSASDSKAALGYIVKSLALASEDVGPANVVRMASELFHGFEQNTAACTEDVRSGLHEALVAHCDTAQQLWRLSGATLRAIARDCAPDAAKTEASAFTLATVKTPASAFKMGLMMNALASTQGWAALLPTRPELLKSLISDCAEIVVAAGSPGAEELVAPPRVSVNHMAAIVAGLCAALDVRSSNLATPQGSERLALIKSSLSAVRRKLELASGEPGAVPASKDTKQHSQATADAFASGWGLASDPSRAAAMDREAQLEMLRIVCVAPGLVDDKSAGEALAAIDKLKGLSSADRNALVLEVAAERNLALSPSGFAIVHRALLATLPGSPYADKASALDSKASAGPALGGVASSAAAKTLVARFQSALLDRNGFGVIDARNAGDPLSASTIASNRERWATALALIVELQKNLAPGLKGPSKAMFKELHAQLEGAALRINAVRNKTNDCVVPAATVGKAKS